MTSAAGPDSRRCDLVTVIDESIERHLQNLVVPGLRNKLGVLLSRFIPRAWSRRVAARVQ